MSVWGGREGGGHVAEMQERERLEKSNSEEIKEKAYMNYIT